MSSSPDVDRVLARVREYESAARTIADDENLSIRARCAALRELGRRGRREEAPGLIESGIWRGCRHFFESDEQVPRDVIDAGYRLLRRGHDRCPECRRPLATIDDLRRWRELGHTAILRRPA